MTLHRHQQHQRGAVQRPARRSSPAATLTYTPAANANGTATSRVDAPGQRRHRQRRRRHQRRPDASRSPSTPVNDAPSFTKGADQTVNEDAGAQTRRRLGDRDLAPARPTRRGQTLTFDVDATTTPRCSRCSPRSQPTGTLTYTPAANANGIGHGHRRAPGQRRHGQRRRRHERRADVHDHRHRRSTTRRASPRARTRPSTRTPGRRRSTGWATADQRRAGQRERPDADFTVTGNNNAALFSRRSRRSPPTAR